VGGRLAEGGGEEIQDLREKGEKEGGLQSTYGHIVRTRLCSKSTRTVCLKYQKKFEKCIEKTKEKKGRKQNASDGCDADRNTGDQRNQFLTEEKRKDF